MTVLVLGGGVSGKAAARLARRLGHDVEVYDRNSVPLAVLRDEGYTIHSGAWSTRLLKGIGLVVVSPGFPQHGAPIVDALGGGLHVISELEFAASHIDVPLAAVTGTNGKTTVTAAAAEMLVASGLRAAAVGNIGAAMSDAVGGEWDALVVEASSFQLRFIDEFHPRAAVVLNVAPDHLDWHGSFDDYLAAKARIHERQTSTDLLAYDADDPGATAAVAGARARLVPISGKNRPERGNGPEGDVLAIGADRYPLPPVDPVWLVDLTAAATVAAELGATHAGIEKVLGEFRPGPHRRELVAERDGIRWVNDSKATNPHAALAAASAYPSVILIAGGRNKGLDLTPLVDVPGVRHIVAIGESAGELVAADPVKVETAADLDAAVRHAGAMARPGDTVLLAPGCASFDMFDDYAHRGDEFARIVRRFLGGTQ